jgi:hypothetical protein
MTLPEGLEWLRPGWWVVHTVAVLVVYSFGYQRGRQSVLRQMRGRDAEAARPAAPPGPR